MAVDNPPLPAPAANSRLAFAKDVVLIVSGLGGFSAVIIAAIALVLSMTIAPLRDDLRLMRQEMQLMRQEMQRGFEAVDADFEAVDAGFKAVRQEMQRGFEAVDADFEAVDDDFKAVRKDLAALSERPMRLETLLEQGAGQGQAPAHAGTGGAMKTSVDALPALFATPPPDDPPHPPAPR